MADRRTCFAGDLTSDAIGKTVIFNETTPTGAVLPHEGTLTFVSHGIFGTYIQLDPHAMPIQVESEGTTVEVRRSPEAG